MKKLTFFLLTALFAAMTAPAALAQVKYVAVIETEMDATSGASADLSAAEVRQITAELRREAVKNLPRSKYNIMTSETVQSQGGAVLEECVDENCVITLGSKIGADYIVRGIISKFRTRLTLMVEMYETENGTLVASSDPVRSESVVELLDKAASASADMYRTFAGVQSPDHGSTPKAPVTYTVTAAANPVDGGAVSRNPNQTNYVSGTRVTLTATPASGYKFTGWSGDANGAKNAMMVTMNGDKTLTANFQYLQTYGLTTSVYPQGGGSIIRSHRKEAYTAGERVTLIATPEEGYAFTGWTGVTSSRKNRAMVKMDGNRAVTANFYLKSIPPPTASNPPQSAERKFKFNFQEMPQIEYSMGGGLFYSGDFGGGMRWSNGEILSMPYHLGGGYLFLDATYAAVSYGYSQGGAKWWEATDAVNPNDLPYMYRMSFDIGVYAKYPNLIKTDLSVYGFESSMNIYPIFGVNYEFPIFGKLDFSGNKSEYVFDGDNTGAYTTGALNGNALSSVWVKIGCGLDMDLTPKTLIRLEILYGARTANWFEIDQADKYGAEKIRLGYGLTFKVGAGFKL